MRLEIRRYLWDAHHAAERAARFVDGKTFDDYLANDMLRAAVERQFEIIGEAFSQLRSLDPEAAALVPDLPRIVGFRNILIHGYATVDDKLVWGIVESHLGPLRQTLHELLNQPD